MNEMLIIKIGGSTFEEEDSTLNNIVELNQQGYSMVLVHGGGKEIDQKLAETNIEPIKTDGKRVTNLETLRIVVSVLDGINTRLVEKLNQSGVDAIKFDSSSGLLKAEIEDPNLGFVGRVTEVELGSLVYQLNRGKIPVISPIATIRENPNQFLNINGDTAAAAVSVNMPGSRLIFMTDVPGVKGEDGLVINELRFKKYLQLKSDGIVTSGMIPKLDEGYKVVFSGGNVQIVSLPFMMAAIYGLSVGTRLIK